MFAQPLVAAALISSTASSGLARPVFDLSCIVDVLLQTLALLALPLAEHAAPEGGGDGGHCHDDERNQITHVRHAGR